MAVPTGDRARLRGGWQEISQVSRLGGLAENGEPLTGFFEGRGRLAGLRPGELP